MDGIQGELSQKGNRVPYYLRVRLLRDISLALTTSTSLTTSTTS